MNDSSTNAQNGVSVRVQGLRKKFDDQWVLQGIDLDIAAGEIFVIMGPSGSGKSVLLKHIIGLEQPNEGDIFIQGQSILTGDIMDQYRLAMVFQSGALLNSLTVGENVGLYLAEHRLKSAAELQQIVAQKLELVGLKGLEDRFPSELSGGLKKRVAIARALVIEPHLILYDEPTSELDPLMSVTVAQEIMKLQRRIGVTSIIVSHDRDLAFGVADRIAMIGEGRIIFVGTPADVNDCPDPFVQNFIKAEFTLK